MLLNRIRNRFTLCFPQRSAAILSGVPSTSEAYSDFRKMTGWRSSSASQPDYLPPGMSRGLPAGLAIHGFAARQPLSEGRLILPRRLRETLTKGNALGLSAFGQCVRRRRLRVVGHLCATSENRYRDTLQLASRPTAFRLPDREAIMETERVPTMSNREIQVGIL